MRMKLRKMCLNGAKMSDTMKSVSINIIWVRTEEWQSRVCKGIVIDSSQRISACGKRYMCIYYG